MTVASMPSRFTRISRPPSMQNYSARIIGIIFSASGPHWSLALCSPIILFGVSSTDIRNGNQQVLNIDCLLLNITEVQKPQMGLRSLQAAYHAFAFAIVPK